MSNSFDNAGRFLFLLLVLCFASGCSALVYEIVWLQLLQLLIGSSAVSLAVLLGTFMGGMCAGSLALPRVMSSGRHPLRVYSLIELGIGICGILVLVGIPYVDRFYAVNAGHGLPGILLRGAVCAVCLMPPTLLMGASLPAIARWLEMTPQGVSWLGFFYGGNIAGAVFGCLLAGFYLLRVHDMATATFVAASLNGTVALAAAGLAIMAPRLVESGDPAQDRPALAPGSWMLLVTIALSGLCALGAEVVWTRLLSMTLGPTVYTFSIILAVFLLGLGLGSGAGAYLARRAARARIALGWCQLLLTAAIAWTAYMLARVLPYWHANPLLSSPWTKLGVDAARSLAAILPAACLWGASFPLALAAIARRSEDPGRLVGKVYAANTAGAIAGAIGFSLLLIPGTGTQQSQRFLITFSLVAALFALWPLMGRMRRAVPLVAAVAAAVFLARSVPATPWGVVAHGRQLSTRAFQGKLLYMGEGMNASIAVSDLYGTRRFHISGKVEASSDQQDMRLQRMLGHLPALLHPRPQSVLVVGCGAGVTAGSFVLHPDVRRIVICELEPLVPPSAEKYFGAENYHVLRDPRTEVVCDDARHYILTTKDKFDVITSDPIHPWVKGSATLYTKEYFELCKEHLKPGGFITQWVPLYESTAGAVESEIATFFQVFPNGTIWGNDTAFEEGYDVVLLGQDRATRIDVDALQRRLDRPDYAPIVKSLHEIALGSAVSLLGTYAGEGPDLRQWLKHAQINSDWNLRLQYLAGMGMDSQGAMFIYEEILRRRKFPRDLFLATPEREKALRAAMGMP